MRCPPGYTPLCPTNEARAYLIVMSQLQTFLTVVVGPDAQASEKGARSRRVMRQQTMWCKAVERVKRRMSDDLEDLAWECECLDCLRVAPNESCGPGGGVLKVLAEMLAWTSVLR